MYVLRIENVFTEYEYSLEELIDYARNFQNEIYSEREAIKVLKENKIDVFTID